MRLTRARSAPTTSLRVLGVVAAFAWAASLAGCGIELEHGLDTALLSTGARLRIGDGEIKRLVAGAVDGLQAADVSVTVATTVDDTAPPELVSEGPLRVARASRGLAIGLLSGALALILALS